MPEPNIPLASGASYVCPDSNVVLECKPLAELPWERLGLRSPVVLVFVPQVLKEVDSKKRDGRIGKRAREFNRLLVQVASQGGCLQLPGQGRDVYITIGRPRRIDWAAYGNEDPDDGDSRVVLEALNLIDIPVEKVVFVSNDVKPIWIAQQYGLKVHHAGDDWRRPIEPSPHDKEVQRLKQRVAELEACQPKLTLDIVVALAKFKRFAVRPLSPDAREEVITGLRQRYPPQQARTPTPIQQLLGYQEGIVTAEAYREFAGKLPGFVDQLPGYLEQEHGQFPFTLIVKNVGPLRAQNLVLSVTCSSGWLNGKPVLMPTDGPSPRETRGSSPSDWLNRHVPFIGRPGRHEMHLNEPPNRSESMRVQCEDFPTGDSWTFSGYACIDPRAAQESFIRAQITAANLHGTIESECRLDFERAEADAADLVDLKTLERCVEAQSWLEIRRRWDDEKYDEVDLFDAKVDY